MEDATIIQQIMEKRNEMTKTERRITDYILNHKHNVAQMTISQLADACGTSTSSITRFTRLFGFDSYLDFRMALARNNIIEKTRFSSTQAEDQREEFGDVYEAIQPEDSIELKTQKLYQIAVTTLQQSVELIDPEQIDLAVDLMIQADNVFCYGQGNSSLVAKDAWGRFSFVTSKFHSIEDAHMQRNIAAILGERDVVLYFSYSGATQELLDVATVLQSTDAKLILITRYSDSPGAKLADCVLICGSNESPTQQGSIAAKFAQLFLIDVLFNEYISRVPEISQEAREKIYYWINQRRSGKTEV